MKERFSRLSKTTRSNLITYALIIGGYLLLQLLVSTHVMTYAMAGLLVPIMSYVCLSLSLNLVVGISGELSLGHAGFMAIGAFTGLVAAQLLAPVVPAAPVCLALSMLVAAAAAALAGLVIGIPVMRLQGDYLAIVTLAFGEIIRNILNNLYVGFDGSLHFSLKGSLFLGMDGGKVLINGPQGAVGIPKLSSLAAGAALVLFTFAVVTNLVNSRSGRAIMAVRDNRIAAESVGIDTTKYRLMAFVVAAALAGMAGALYAMNFSTIVPKKFDFNTSILILVFVVFGGMGNLRGGIIAAAALTILPEKLRFLGNFRMLIYAVLLILVMLFTNGPKLRARLDAVRAGVLGRRAARADAPEGGDA